MALPGDEARRRRQVGGRVTGQRQGEYSNNRQIARSGNSVAKAPLGKPGLGQGQTNVGRMSGTLVRGMEFDRKWGRA